MVRLELMCCSLSRMSQPSFQTCKNEHLHIPQHIAHQLTKIVKHIEQLKRQESKIDVMTTGKQPKWHWRHGNQGLDELVVEGFE